MYVMLSNAEEMVVILEEFMSISGHCRIFHDRWAIARKVFFPYQSRRSELQWRKRQSRYQFCLIKFTNDFKLQCLYFGTRRMILP